MKESLSKTWFLDSCLDKSTNVSHHQISLFNIRILLGNRTSKHANQLIENMLFSEMNINAYTNFEYLIITFTRNIRFISICNILILASLNLLRQTPYYYPKIERKREEGFKTKSYIFWNVTVCVMPLYLNILSFPSKLDIAKTFLRD